MLICDLELHGEEYHPPLVIPLIRGGPVPTNLGECPTMRREDTHYLAKIYLNFELMIMKKMWLSLFYAPTFCEPCNFSLVI